MEEIELEEGTVHYVIEGEDVTIENEMVTENLIASIVQTNCCLVLNKLTDNWIR